MESLIIDWEQMPTYNTIMSVAAGSGLLLLVWLGRQLIKDRQNVVTEGWALAFGVLGFILTATGLHMTLTWPLAAGGFAFDNIVFGETSLAFGVLLLAVAGYLWKRGVQLTDGPDALTRLVKVAQPISVFIFGMGLGLFGIAIAGVTYQLFAAPPQEPIAGLFASWPLVEAIFISTLFALVGIGAVLFPFALTRKNAVPVIRKFIGVCWTLAGAAFLLFGAMNFFTHIGLIVNTMPTS